MWDRGLAPAGLRGQAYGDSGVAGCLLEPRVPKGYSHVRKCDEVRKVCQLQVGWLAVAVSPNLPSRHRSRFKNSNANYGEKK